MNIEFRSERPGDEDAIDVVECRAFRNMDKANLVRSYRERYPGFGRRYSVCAWDDNRMVGHALFLPFAMNLMNEQVRAVALSPDGVIPERQGQGIGTAMNRYGLERARQDGFAVAVTNGAPAFYRRFGYRSCFGFARTTIDREALPAPTRELSAWPVRSGDLPWLVKCHEQEWSGVDFAWNRGKNMREWTAPFACTVIWRTLDGRRAAYAEGWSDGRGWRQILGDEPELVRDVIATVKPSGLEQHPAGWLARHVLEPKWGGATVDLRAAGLACELQTGVLDEYQAAVGAGGRQPGHFIWPLSLAVCS